MPSPVANSEIDRLADRAANVADLQRLFQTPPDESRIMMVVVVWAVCLIEEIEREP